MAPKEQIKLLDTWRGNLFEEYSISEIMEISKKRTKPWVFNSLKQLTDEKLLIVRRKANINLYRLNLDNPFLLQTLQYLGAERNSRYRYLDAVSGMIKDIPLRNYCLLGFGEKFCFLVEDKKSIEKIRVHVKGLKVHYFTFDGFVDVLLRGEEIGKRIFEEHRLFLNADIYYGLIKEAHRKGFGGR